MELFDIIELGSYVTPLTERLQEAQSTRQPAGGLLAVEEGTIVLNPDVHEDWTTTTMNVYAPCDLILVSVDSIRFHVHQGRLSAASINSFSGHLPMPLVRVDEQSSGGHSLPVLEIPYIGAVLNILLYIMYNRVGRINNPNPSLSILSTTVLALKKYGVSLDTSTSESSLLFELFSNICQSGSALEVYAAAASYAPDLHHIAVHASQFLLSLNLYSITDDVADTMGPVYLRRLFMLHMNRVNEFKKLIVGPPRTHTPTSQCNAETLSRVWALSTAYLTWAAKPNVAITTIDNVMASVVDRLSACHQCETSLRERFDTFKRDWRLVKASI